MTDHHRKVDILTNEVIPKWEEILGSDLGPMINKAKDFFEKIFRYEIEFKGSEVWSTSIDLKEKIVMGRIGPKGIAFQKQGNIIEKAHLSYAEGEFTGDVYLTGEALQKFLNFLNKKA